MVTGRCLTWPNGGKKDDALGNFAGDERMWSQEGMVPQGEGLLMVAGIWQTGKDIQQSVSPVF